MSREEEYSEYFDVLELTPEASPAEVREAYANLKDLYSSNSFVLSPLEDELSDEWKDEVVRKIEKAYHKLTELFEKDPSWGQENTRARDVSLQEELKNIRIFNGEALRQIREKLGVDLHDVGKVTKINTRYLEKIEEEDFAALPEKVFLRGYIISYAKHLSLDPGKVVQDYMSLHSAWEKNRGK